MSLFLGGARSAFDRGDSGSRRRHRLLHWQLRSLDGLLRLSLAAPIFCQGARPIGVAVVAHSDSESVARFRRVKATFAFTSLHIAKPEFTVRTFHDERGANGRPI